MTEEIHKLKCSMFTILSKQTSVTEVAEPNFNVILGLDQKPKFSAHSSGC
jgi:hypothetical protein